MVSQGYGLAWERECLDLTELARLRWVEGWKIGRLAEYFEISGSAVKKRLEAVKDDPIKWGAKMKRSKIRES